MLKEVADAIKREDYRSAGQLLQTLDPEELENPWVLYYQARVDEAQGNLDRANLIYREILQTLTHPKILAQTRQGLERLEDRKHREQEQKNQEQQEAIAAAKSSPAGKELGILILEPLASEDKQKAAQEFAKIMNIDPYSARLQIPSRSWRLYRTGQIGELQVYTQALQAAAIPCFCQSLSVLEEISLYQVSYFASVIPQAQVVGEKRSEPSSSLVFDWSEVKQRVEGLLPLFEEYEEKISRGASPQRKTKTQDYAQVCDLHLPKRNIIVRLCDQNYQFQQGILFSERQQGKNELTTLRDNWNNLMHYIKTQIPDVPVQQDFTPFAETALEFAEPLRQINPQLSLSRLEETPWDAAFELYSGLYLLQLQGKLT